MSIASLVLVSAGAATAPSIDFRMGLVTISAPSVSTTLTFNLENASVSELVSEISQQTGMTIVVASPTELEDLPRASYRFDQYDVRSAFRLLKKERGLCAYRALGGEPRPVVIVLRSCKTVDHDCTVGIAEPLPAPLVWSNSDRATSRESGACLSAILMRQATILASPHRDTN
jgi:hypothetical protein